jgi:hypothetical protein
MPTMRKSKGEHVDPKFPPDASSLGPTLHVGKEWMRAQDLGIGCLFNKGDGDKVVTGVPI